MQREEKSERSRKLVLDAALATFLDARISRHQRARHRRGGGRLDRQPLPSLSRQGSDLPDAARRVPRDRASEQFPLYRALQRGDFPDNLEDLGYAARDSVRQYRRYMLLIFVDVIEFDGTHIREFYKGLRSVSSIWSNEHPGIQPRLRENVSASSAMHWSDVSSSTTSSWRSSSAFRSRSARSRSRSSARWRICCVAGSRRGSSCRLRQPRFHHRGERGIHHRGTENTEKTERKTEGHESSCSAFLCVLCVSVVNAFPTTDN